MKDCNVMTDGKKTFLISQLQVIEEHMIVFEKLQQAKEIITQLVVCWTIIILEFIIRDSSRFK